MDFQSGGFEKFLDEFRAPRFAEFRSGNFGKLDLLLSNPIGIFTDPIESASTVRRNGKLFNRVVGGARGKCNHQKKDTGDESEFHVFRARILAASALRSNIAARWRSRIEAARRTGSRAGRLLRDRGYPARHPAS